MKPDEPLSAVSRQRRALGLLRQAPVVVVQTVSSTVVQQAPPRLRATSPSGRGGDGGPWTVSFAGKLTLLDRLTRS
jgi:hypothetical protein